MKLEGKVATANTLDDSLLVVESKTTTITSPTNNIMKKDKTEIPEPAKLHRTRTCSVCEVAVEEEEAGLSSPEKPCISQEVAASISDHLAKRQRRAERFGLHLQVTEAERRQIRAVR